MSVWRSFWETKQKGERERENVHLVELAARGNNLLDAELAELSLELAELLHQVILALVPELDSLNFSRRLEREIVMSVVWFAYCVWSDEEEGENLESISTCPPCDDESLRSF